jgi:PPOX class probable F420-dependent enzyme
MGTSLPAEIRGQKYISLATFRKNGAAVHTPVWFAEDNGKLYVMTRSDSGKYKRIRNNPAVTVAPSSIRGNITGPDFPARVRFLPEAEWNRARQLIRDKYWLARIPFLWSKNNVYLEISL